MNELALFAGAGGGLLASKWLLGWQTVCYVEWDDYRVEVIKARIRDGLLDDAPIWDDITTFNGRPWRGCVDIVTAGFPCQPFSVAGKQKAQSDERNLWPDTIRVIGEVRPEWCFLENVPGLLSGSHGYFGQILRDLAESRYDASWKVLSAAEVGAPHKRDRLWVLAHATNDGQSECTAARSVHAGTFNAIQEQARRRRASGIEGCCSDVAHAESFVKGRRHCQCGTSHSKQRAKFDTEHSATNGDWWAIEPDVGRVASGVAHRVDRLKALGDGQVPAVVAAAWKLLTE